MRLRLSPLMLLPLLAGCALGPTVPKPDVHTPVAFEAPTDITQPGVPSAMLERRVPRRAL